MVGQEPHLARHCAVPHDTYPKHILLPTLAIDQSLPAEANLAPHLELHPKQAWWGQLHPLSLTEVHPLSTIVLTKQATMLAKITPQLGSPPGGHGCTLRHSRWPIGGSRHLPSDGHIGGGSRLPGNDRHSCCQCSNVSLLTTIHSCCPCHRGHCSTSRDGIAIADGVLGLARKAVMAHGILVGAGACTTLPCNNLGRR
jgi:hypothetical protein